jgi:hypothetical protein
VELMKQEGWEKKIHLPALGQIFGTTE